MDFGHHLRRLLGRGARSTGPARRPSPGKTKRRLFLESLETRIVMASDLLDDLTAFQAGSKGQPGDPLSKVGYDLASTNVYFESTGTAPPAATNNNVSLMRFDSTRTQVLIEASSVVDNPSSLEAKLQGLGFVETGEFGRMISGWLPINQIDALSVLPELKIASASYRPEYATGTVTSQGDQAMRADLARSTFGVTGAGVTVGVISDSFNALGGYASDVTTGNLPPNVQIIQDSFGSDEGRAMSQIVYDVAPQSNLAFATANGGQPSLASNIIALANAGSKVIVDDVFYLAEPFFQNGVVAQAVNTVAAQDVSYFSSAGNQDRQAYSATFTPGTLFAAGQFPSAAGAPFFFGGRAHDFDPGPAVNNFQSFTLTTGAGMVIDFQWDQTFGSLGGAGSANDVDIYVLDSAGTVVAGSAAGNLGGDPLELFGFQNTTASTQTYSLMIVSFSGIAPGLIKYIDLQGDMGSVAFATNSGTTFGHANTSGAASVGAAWYQQTPQFGSNPPVLEDFSSSGGTPILFANNGTRLASPIDLRKTDFVAPDGVITTLSAGSGLNPFFGTSAAAPHAAGVAALMKERNPAATATQIRNAMASTAIPMANPFGSGYNYAAGAGLIQASAAVNIIRPTGVGKGQISGVKFNDLHGATSADPPDGIRQADEPGVPNIYIIVDLNNDGKLSITEPAAVTDNFGRYTILNVPAGSGYIVRELSLSDLTLFQTRPGPAGITFGASPAIPFTYTNVSVPAGGVIAGLDFGNNLSVVTDFGDAPAPYGTTLAGNGARHGIVLGFQLGALGPDGEADGQASADGMGDDLNNLDDEDGVTISAMTPGGQATITVTVADPFTSPGKLQGWIDFDGDQKFEPSEKILNNVALTSGTYTYTIGVPAGAVLGQTFARFRYGLENDLGPTGQSSAGEVEDYQVTIFPFNPVAVNDTFPLPGQPPIKQNEPTILDVLANDIPTAAPGRLNIVTNTAQSTFPRTLPSGSTVSVMFDISLGRDVIVYTADESVLGPETFTYQVQDQSNPPRKSNVATVTVNVSLRVPDAIDNTFIEAADAANPLTDDLDVMSNDLFGLGINTRILPGSITPLMATPTLLTANSDNTLHFFAPAGFTGTAIFQYQLTDDDGEVSDPAFVTIQVVNGGAAVTEEELFNEGYLGEVDVFLLDANGAPTDTLIVNEGETFQVLVTALDLRPNGSNANRGVESVFMDMLLPIFRSNVSGVNKNFAEPIAIMPNPDYTGFVDAKFSLDQFSTGLGDELGGTHNSSGGGVGTGRVEVFTVTFMAIQSTADAVGQNGGIDGAVRFVADPPDSADDEISQMPDPNTVVSFSEPPTIEDPPNPPVPNVNQTFQVFFRPSGNLVIMGAGQGDFVNRVNMFDVNEDGMVAPLDAMEVINDINAHGSRPLNANTAKPAAMIDTNWDNWVTPLDALNVINYLNYHRRHGTPGVLRGTNQGEGSQAGGAATDLSMLSPTATSSTSPSSTNTTSAPLLPTSSSSSTSTSTSSSSTPSSSTGSTSTSTSTGSVDPAAADELYAQQQQALENLKKKFKR